MEQHEKVWIPVRKKNRTTHRIIKGPVIVMKREEILDLMQEAVERAHILRGDAENILDSKLQ